MQKLNYKKTLNLNNALNSTEAMEDGKSFKSVLKSGKHLSGENYLKVMGVKKILRNALEDASEKEKALFEDYDGVNNGSSWNIVPKSDSEEDVKKSREEAKDLGKKLEQIQKELSVEIPDAFINEKEFLEWTKECSNEPASILAEFLLIGFDK